MVLVVNEYTASAAEVMAGALQDHGRALLVGMPTFGKGSVQTIIRLPDASGLKLTTALYATPSGRIVQANGLEPDMIVPALDPDLLDKNSKSREQDLIGHLQVPGQESTAPKSPVAMEDNQLYIAYQVLKATMKMDSSGSPWSGK